MVGGHPAATHPALVFTLGSCYVACSAAMIHLNKFLMHKHRFPFAGTLVLGHMTFAAVLSLILYWVRPSLFPSLVDPERRVKVDRQLILRGAMPVAALFAFQLVLTNAAYLHCSVAFLQMMKEANLVLVYTFSLMVALERFTWRGIGILVGILIATSLTIHGEVLFSWAGFVLQGTSQLFESAKIVLQALLLSSVGWKLDPLTYVLVVMPLCMVILSTMLGFIVYAYPNEHFPAPTWADVHTWWPYLLANSATAFMLNIVIASFVKNSSAVAFILAGIVKDVMIVVAGGLIFHENIAMMQKFGFTLQLLLVLLWSLMKIMPEKFENGIFYFFWAVITGPCRAGDDKDGQGVKPTAYGATKGA